MWTEITRPKYQREGQRYASDLTDAEWALIEPQMPAVKGLGRPRETELRTVLDAIFSIARTGCQWRMLPQDFPAFTTVQGYFYDWRDNGLFEKINFELLLQAREAAGREASPSAGVIDSQSVKTTESGGPRGYDAAKKVKGRKRHIVTDTTGLMVGAAVHPADVQDRDGAPLVVEAIHDLFPGLRPLLADSAYAGDKLLKALAKFGKWSIRSCGAWPTSSALQSCRAAGSSNARWLGSIATAALQSLSRPRSSWCWARRRPSRRNRARWSARHLVSTLVGLLIVQLCGPAPWAAALAVGLAMVAMHLTGTFHPPAGIDPLVVVVNDLSWSFLFAPVGVGALLLALFAFCWHNLVAQGASRGDIWPTHWW